MNRPCDKIKWWTISESIMILLIEDETLIMLEKDAHETWFPLKMSVSEAYRLADTLNGVLQDMAKTSPYVNAILETRGATISAVKEGE